MDLMGLYERLLAAALNSTTLDESLVLYLKSTALSHFVVEKAWVWPLCETLHFIGLALLIGAIAPLDLRLMGFLKRVPISALHSLAPWAIAGFVINLVTGTLFFVGSPGQYIANSSWYLKLLFLAIAGVNMLAFETTQKTRAVAMDTETTTPGVFKTIGAVSLVSWFMVLYWGRMLAFLGNAF